MIAVYMTGAGTILLLLVPFIPGLRDIPRLIPVHRLIWRGWEHPEQESAGQQPPAGHNAPTWSLRRARALR